MKLRRKSSSSPRQRQLREPVTKPAAPAFSYRSRHRSQEQDPKSRLKTGHFWLQRFGLIILLVAGTASAVNVLSLSTTAKVVPLSSETSQLFLRDQSVYEAAANQLLEDSPWNRNKITINTAELRKAMLVQFPELANASITLPLLAHRPIVYIEASQPALILVNSSGSYVIDTSGKALLRAADAAAFARFKVPVVHDQSGFPVRLNRQTLPAPNVNFIQGVLTELAAKKFTPAALTLPAATSELDVQIAGQPYFIKFNLQSNTPREQAGTFLATITQLQKQNITPASYVDVRVSGRAYYK